MRGIFLHPVHNGCDLGVSLQKGLWNLIKKEVFRRK